MAVGIDIFVSFVKKGNSLLAMGEMAEQLLAFFLGFAVVTLNLAERGFDLFAQFAQFGLRKLGIIIKVAFLIGAGYKVL